MYNTIRLLTGKASLSDEEYKDFIVGDTFFNAGTVRAEIRRWDMSQKKEALECLEEHRCKHAKNDDKIWNITEYALEFFECNANGEFVSGGDFYIATLDPKGLPYTPVTALLSSQNYIRLKPTDPRKEIKELREKTGMSQSSFASYFELPVRTLQEWEQGRKSPPPYLPKLLKRILVLERLKNS